jgi:hypothetical protein
LYISFIYIQYVCSPVQYSYISYKDKDISLQYFSLFYQVVRANASSPKPGGPKINIGSSAGGVMVDGGKVHGDLTSTKVVEESAKVATTAESPVSLKPAWKK